MGHLGTSPFALWGENIFCNPQLKLLPLALSESVSVLLSEHLPLNPWSSRCSKELNQWEALTEYGQSKGHINPYLVLECAWRVSNWTAMKEALVQVRPLPHRWFSRAQVVWTSREFSACSKLGVLADERQLLGSKYFQFSNTFPTLVHFGSCRKN